MIEEELRRVELELESNRTNLDLLERYIVLSKRLGRDSTKDWFPLYSSQIKTSFNKNNILMEKYIEIQIRHSFGEPAWNAYHMIQYCGSSRKWAENVIENATVGNPSGAAYFMLEYYESDKKWVEKVIENAKVGNPTWDAYLMPRYHGSNRSWAEKIIENAEIGEPAFTSFYMVLNYASDRKWAEAVIEKSKNEDPIIARWMVESCGSSQEWADRVWRSK